MHSERRQSHQSQGQRHSPWLMLACVSIVALALILSRGGGGGVLPYILFLLCPLMHLLMMFGVLKHNHGTKRGVT